MKSYSTFIKQPKAKVLSPQIPFSEKRIRMNKHGKIKWLLFNDIYGTMILIKCSYYMHWLPVRIACQPRNPQRKLTLHLPIYSKFNTSKGHLESSNLAHTSGKTTDAILHPTTFQWNIKLNPHPIFYWYSCAL